MTLTEAETQKRSIPINRWLIVLMLIAIVFFAGIYPPVSPVVLLPGEPITDVLFTLPVIGDFSLTNTILTAIIIDLIIFLMAFFIIRGKGDETKPSNGLALVFETIIGGLYDMVESTTGKKWARGVFPLVMTIILVVLVANLIKIFPGLESIGIIEHAHHEGEGYLVEDLIPGVLSTITSEHVGEGEAGYELIPFFRSPSTDLTFTLAIALTAMFMVQLYGVRANGLSYFTKFFNFGPFLKMWIKRDLNAFDAILPFIDIFVGILELISEFAKIISFSFRLLGSMFGGAILVIVLGTLLPPLTFGMYFLEIFFGVIQAVVFGMLTLVFITVATQAHGHNGEDGEGH
jgi:F-type H+-transporting ATPase subunit a